jgi:predicted nucleic acid-binding protein
LILYLLDENVIREMHPGGAKAVTAWLESVDDDQIRLSAMTFFEKRRGWERRRRKLIDQGQSAAEAEARLMELAAYEKRFEGRIVPIDAVVSAEWARLLGAKDNNQRDVCLAATARVHDLVLVTRNVADFEGRGVRVLNPFKTPAVIVRV